MEKTSFSEASYRDPSSGVLECAVCLQSCIHPAQLPCGHIFCFLCVKGVANQSKKCAMCRQEIPCDFLENPKLIFLPPEQDETTDDVNEDGFQWFYEGRNGWWKYDLRTNRELDLAFQSEAKRCELLIAGFLYIIDFDSMLQLRRTDTSRRRRIKRDAVAIPIKGIAGIKTPAENRVKTPVYSPVETQSSVNDSDITDVLQETITSMNRMRIGNLTIRDDSNQGNVSNNVNHEADLNDNPGAFLDNT